MQDKIEKAERLLRAAGHLARQHDAYKDLTSITVRHPVTGEDVELPVTKEMKNELKRKLEDKMQEVKDEVITLDARV